MVDDLQQQKMGALQKTLQKRTCPTCGQPISGLPEQSLPPSQPEQTTTWLRNEAELQSTRQKLGAMGIPTSEWSKYISSPDAQGRIYFTPPQGTAVKRPGIGQQPVMGDRPPPNSPLMYTQVLPPSGMKYVYNQQTGERSTAPINNSGKYGQITPPAGEVKWEGPGNSRWEEQQRSYQPWPKPPGRGPRPPRPPYQSWPKPPGEQPRPGLPGWKQPYTDDKGRSLLFGTTGKPGLPGWKQPYTDDKGRSLLFGTTGKPGFQRSWPDRDDFLRKMQERKKMEMERMGGAKRTF